MLKLNQVSFVGKELPIKINFSLNPLEKKVAILSFFLLFLLALTLSYFNKNSIDGLINSVGIIISVVSILLAIKIFRMSEKSQADVRELSNEIHSISLMSYKSQTMHFLLDNYIKSSDSSNPSEHTYWNFRYSFENFDTLFLKIGQRGQIHVKVKGTNNAPFEPPSEHIISYIYWVEILSSDMDELPMGNAYCTYVDGKNKLSLSCNKVGLENVMYDFIILSPGIPHSFWVGDSPIFYKRLKNTKQYFPVKAS